MALSLIHWQDDVSFFGTSPQPWHSSFGGVNVPAGSLIVAIVLEAFNSAGGGSLTDDAGNTYTALITKNPNATTADGFVRIWYCNNCLNLTAGANNLIYTSAGGAGTKLAARWMAFSGAAGGNPFDAAVTASATGSSTIATITSGIPAMANEFFLGTVMAFGANVGNFGLPIAPFNNNTDALGTSAGELFLGTDLNAGTTAQVLKNSSSSGTAPWAAIVVAVKPPQTLVAALAAGSYSMNGASPSLLTNRIVGKSIGTGGGASATSITITVPAGGVPAGNLIVIYNSCDNTNFVSTCVDQAGNTYHKITDVTSWQNNFFYCYNCLALTAGQTITIADGGAGALHAWSAAYYTQIKTTADPYDAAVHAVASGTTAAPSVTSGTPAIAGELFVAFNNAHGGTNTATQDAGHGGWAAPPNAANNPGNPSLMAGSQVNAGTGTLTYAPTLSTSLSTDTFVYGFKPRPAGATSQTLVLGANPGSYAITGGATRKVTGENWGPGSYVITGSSPALLAGKAMRLAAGSYAITGGATQKVTAEGITIGSYAITGAPPALITAKAMKLAAGSYAIAGAGTKTVTAENWGPGSYTITGAPPALFATKAMKLAAGSYAITGDAVAMPEARVVLGAPGVYMITGSPPSLTTAKTMALAAGSYALTGAGTNLDTGAGAGPGSYVITGADAALFAAKAMLLDAGSYALTGADAALFAAKIMSLAAGSYALTGSNPALMVARVLQLASGVYTMFGAEPSLDLERAGDTPMRIDVGVYTMTGFPADLIIVIADDPNDTSNGYGGQRGQSHGLMSPPPIPVPHPAELELFRNLEYARGVSRAAPPLFVAHRNLTTTQHPTSRPVTAPITGRHK